MHTSVSFANPYEIYAPKEVLNDLGIESGTPVTIELEIEEVFLDALDLDPQTNESHLGTLIDALEIEELPEEEDQLRDTLISSLDDVDENPSVKYTGSVRDRREFKLGDENHALFYGIYNRITELPEDIRSEFSEFTTDDPEDSPFRESPFVLEDEDSIAEYLAKISHLNQNRIGDGLVIGCGITELLIRHARGEQVETPHFNIPLSLFSEILDQNIPNIDNIERFTGVIREPEEVYFCTYNYDLTKQQERELIESLASQRYFSPYNNYLFGHHLIGQHGPVRSELLDDEIDLLKVSKQNINLTRIHPGHVHFNTEPVDSDIFRMVVESEIDESNRTEEEEEDGIWEIEDDLLYLDTTDGFINYSIRHPVTDEEYDKALTILEGITERIKAECETESAKHAFDDSAPEISEKDYWIFDTNAIYRQSSHREPTCITDFVIQNYQIYGKEIVIPKDVIFEINKHKDANSRTQRASEQGIENLRILKRLSEAGFFDLTIQPIEEGYSPAAKGAVDLQLLSTLPENGVLLTGDNRLLEIGELMGYSVYDVTELRGPSSETEFEERWWGGVAPELSDGPLPKHEVEEIISEQAEEISTSTDFEPRGDYIAEIYNNWMERNLLVESIEDDEIITAIANPVKIVPTFELLTNISSYVVDFEDESYFTGEFLEIVRQAIGRMGKHERPSIDFCIPNQFTYMAEEVGQVDSIYEVTKTKNTNFHSLEVSDDSGSLEKDTVRAAKMEGAILMIEDSQSDLYKISNLLEVDVAKIQVT